MKKYKCEECQAEQPCVLEWFDYPPPSKCPAPGDAHAIWREVKELSNQLPKLTAEVFERKDCPERARWAAVDGNGMVYCYVEKPTCGVELWDGPGFSFIDFGFDASDWRNSLIERPAKLPEWCKVGAWVWNEQFGYGKVAIPRKEIGATAVDWVTGDRGRALPNQLAQSRLRPFSDDEAAQQVGKIIKSRMCTSVITGYESYNKVFYLGDNASRKTQKDISATGATFLDGTPFGVLEHLNNGEWVK